MQNSIETDDFRDEAVELSREADLVTESPSKSKRESMKEGLKLVKIKSKNKTPKKEKNAGGGASSTRFLGEGISFKAKLIGVEEIDEARGDKLCQDTLSRLKQVVKTSGTHKQRIALTISLSGVKLKEEKTGIVMYHHPVHHISFISQDVGDDRAFGYICSPTPTSFHFVAIKTEKAASQVVITLRDLFQTVLDMKKQQKIQKDEVDQSCNSFDSEISIENLPEVNKTDSETAQSEPIYEDMSKFEVEDKQLNADRVNQVNDLLTGDLLDLNFEVEQLQQSIAQMNFSLSAVAPFSDNLTPLNAPLKPNNESETISPVPSPEPVVADPPEPFPSRNVDRYAVFEEIDSVPSIFENPALIDLPFIFPPESVSPIPSTDFTMAAVEIEPNCLPNQPEPTQPTLSIFAELDPLGKDRPFVDRKNFFHDIKNPPKKVLKDLMGNSIDSNSPPTANNSVSFSFEPPYIPPALSNPFLQPNSPPAPRVPPRIPVNPFYPDNFPPPATPPPILMTSRSSDPTFAVMPSPPSHSNQRKCVTPTPPLPKRKPTENHPQLFYPRPQLRHQSSLASPPIPIPIRNTTGLVRSTSVSTTENSGPDSPIYTRRNRVSTGSEGRVSPANWDVFDDPVENLTPTSIRRKINHTTKEQYPDPFETNKDDPFFTSTSKPITENSESPIPDARIYPVTALCVALPPSPTKKPLDNLLQSRSDFQPVAQKVDILPPKAPKIEIRSENVEIAPVTVRSRPKGVTSLDRSDSLTKCVALPASPTKKTDNLQQQSRSDLQEPSFGQKVDITLPPKAPKIEIRSENVEISTGTVLRSRPKAVCLDRSDSLPIKVVEIPHITKDITDTAVPAKSWTAFNESPTKSTTSPQPIVIESDSAEIKSWAAFDSLKNEPIPANDITISADFDIKDAFPPAELPVNTVNRIGLRRQTTVDSIPNEKPNVECKINRQATIECLPGNSSDDSNGLSPVKSPLSPDESSIFRKKQDPFEDDFFLSLEAKK